jgi:hypothetical protein
MLDGVATRADVLFTVRGGRGLDYRNTERQALGREGEDGRPDFHLVAFRERARLDERRPVHGRGIHAARMQHELSVLRAQLRMIARNGGLSDENMTRRITTYRQ